MRAKLLLTSVSAMAIAAPAFAADLSSSYIPPTGDPVYSPQPMGVVGHLEFGIGLVSFDDDFLFDDSDTVGVFLGAGRANIPFGGGAWNLELETGGSALFDDGSSYSTIGAAGHLWTRLNSAAVGVYGAVNFPTGGTFYTLGVEGEAYLGNFTLGANADYSWIDGFGGGPDSAWTARAYADAYLAPDWRFGGQLSFISTDFADAWSAGLDTEYRFSGTPFSLWAEGSYTSWDSGGPDIVTGMVGFRVFMDGAGTTLQQHDREVPWDSGLLGNRLSVF